MESLGPIRYSPSPVKFSHWPELERLYQERRALLEVDRRTCIDVVWLDGRIARVTQRIDALLEETDVVVTARLAPPRRSAGVP